MAARPGDLQQICRVDLFAGLHHVSEPAPVLHLAARGVEVDHVASVEPLASVGQQPGGAVRVAAFLVVGEHSDDVAIGDVPLAPEADQVGHQAGDLVFDVDGAAAVEPAVPLGEREGVHRPILPSGLYHIEVGQEEDRPGPAAAAQPDYQVLMLRMRSGELHIPGGKAGGGEPACERLRGAGGARVLGRVDRHQLGQDRPCHPAVRLGKCLLRREGRREKQTGGERQMAELHRISVGYGQVAAARTTYSPRSGRF